MIALALVGTALVATSGLASLAWRQGSDQGDRAANALLCTGTACVLASCVGALASGGAEAAVPWSAASGPVGFRLDAIAAMFLLQVAVLASSGSVYGLAYWKAADHPRNHRKLRVFYGLTAGGMNLLFLAADARVFLTGWELMAIGAFMTITTDDDDAQARDAGRLYLYCTKVATLALMAMFAVWYGASGTLALGPIASAPPLLFVLALIGFGLKAGAMPLHVWLPSAHGSAPSHVSALMSGVLIKTGIYGLVRVLGWATTAPAWWGYTVFALGVVSSVLGVAFAIGQHDIKRLLAYHSIENIGIILLGLGTASVGRSTGHADLVVLGLAGALLHTWNHGLFKALLFLGAGSVIHGTGLRDIDHMGGLSRRMRWTSLAFLAGAVAICGLPPLNGFVSEFLVYSGFLHSLTRSSGETWLLGALGAPALALTGALALLCFAKVFGVAFLGEPRTPEAAAAHPAGAVMLAPMAVLVALCAFIGVAPVAVAPVLDAAIDAWSGAGDVAVASLAPVGTLSVLAVVTIAVLATTWAALGRRLASGPQGATVTWDCGYAAPQARMQYTASSFAEQILVLFGWATFPVEHRGHLGQALFPAAVRFDSHVRDPALDIVLVPGARLAARALSALHALQRGSLQAALVYLLVALVLAFAWI